jgi:hypothetical protein
MPNIVSALAASSAKAGSPPVAAAVSITLSRSRAFSVELPKPPSRRLQDGRDIVIRPLKPGDDSRLFAFLDKARVDDPVGYAKRFPRVLVATESGAIAKQPTAQDLVPLMVAGVAKTLALLDSKGRIHGLFDYDELPLSRLASWTGLVAKGAEANVYIDEDFREAGAGRGFLLDAAATLRREGFDYVRFVKAGAARCVALERPDASPREGKEPSSPMPGGDD